MIPLEEEVLREFREKFVECTIDCAMDDSHGRICRHEKCFLKDNDFPQVEQFLLHSLRQAREQRDREIVEEIENIKLPWIDQVHPSPKTYKNGLNEGRAEMKKYILSLLSQSKTNETL